MAVTRVELIDWSGGEGAQEVNYSERYWVQTDDRDDGPLTVRSAVGVVYGDTYSSGNESDIRAVATNITESRVSDQHFLDWYVDVEYTNPEDDEDVDNPLSTPVAENLNWDSQQRQIYVDANNSRISNTAGDPFNEPVEADDNLPTLAYTVNQATFPTALAQQVRNAVNISAWKGFSARTAKVSSIQSRRLFHKTIGVYYQVNYNFAIKPEDWRVRLESYGWREKYDDNGTTKFRSKPQQSQPLPLDANGAFIDPLSGIPPAIVEVEFYPELDFNILFPFL